MLTCKAYLVPRSLDEAFAAMAEHSGHYRLIAGGTDTFPSAREGRAGEVDIPVLIGVSRIPELCERRVDDRRILDVPHVTSVILEDPDPIGPLGVKGIGEPAMVPTIPAVMNAIYDAVGVRITALPATPEKVLEAIKTKERAAQERVAAE